MEIVTESLSRARLSAVVSRLLTPRRPAIDSADVGVEIIGVTDQMHSADDIERVLVAVQSSRYER